MYRELMGLCMHILRLEIHMCRQLALVETGRLRQKEESMVACSVKERKLLKRIDVLASRMSRTAPGTGWRMRQHEMVVSIIDEPRRVLGRAAQINTLMKKWNLPLIVRWEEAAFKKYPVYDSLNNLTFVGSRWRLVTNKTLTQSKEFAGRERHNKEF